MNYSHTQNGPLHYLLFAIAFSGFLFAWFAQEEMFAVVIVLCISVLMLSLGLMFQHLTVRDEGDFLQIQFGPLEVFGKRIPYADIQSVQQGRSSIADGWGIHCIPGRGWTYNLWGFDCAELKVSGKTIRIGSDDAAGLVAFLKSKVDNA